MSRRLANQSRQAAFPAGQFRETDIDLLHVYHTRTDHRNLVEDRAIFERDLDNLKRTAERE